MQLTQIEQTMLQEAEDMAARAFPIEDYQDQGAGEGGDVP